MVAFPRLSQIVLQGILKRTSPSLSQEKPRRLKEVRERRLCPEKSES